MDYERGLLDLMIARLDQLSFKEKYLLSELFATEDDFIKQTGENIEILIGRKLAFPLNIDEARSLAQRDEAQSRLRGISWVSCKSPAYPPLLREIYDPPVALFYRGSLPNPEAPLAAIVGTRTPSPQAAAQAYRIAHDLARAGVSVVSGLALGIDAMAHRGNVDGGAPNVAVLGSGLDKVFPSTNRTLAVRILEGGGCLLSEYPPGDGPRKWHFPARNRIISGLARAVLIVEAPQKSGALITARFALEHNRELWVASCGVSEDGEQKDFFDKRGSSKLVEDGAQIIRNASDILGAWNMETTGFETPEITSGASASGGLALASSLAQSLGVTL